MRHFDARDTRERLPLPDLVATLRQAWIDGADVPARQALTLDGDTPGTVLVMPAWRRERRFGVKTITIFPHNTARGLPSTQAVYTLFDARDGRPLAVMDGGEITARRTAAQAALAASLLARRDARRLLVLGAGRIAALLPEAMRAVRPIDTVAVWNHRPERAEALAATWRDEGLDAQAVTDLEAACRTADIVSCATLSPTPRVRGDWLAPGAHLDLIGSFTPDMREADGACFERAEVFVDSDEALAKSGDLLAAMREGRFDASRRRATLAMLVRGEHGGRSDDGQVTLFKSVGHALADLAAAEMVIDAPARRRAVRLYWEDFRVGEPREFGATEVTRDAVLSFATAFDPQPFHLEDAAAEASLFGRLSASGWHTCAMAMRMLCDHYLLESSSLGSPGIEDVRWTRPVYPGDVLTVRFTPLQSRPMASRPQVGLVRSRWEVFNQRREAVLTMEGWGMFGRRPAG